MLNKKLFAASLLTISTFSFAETTVPNTFASGDTISAETMNENFNTIADATNVNETDIAALLTRIETLESSNTEYETLLARIDSLEEINTQAETLSTEIARFDGVFTGNGRNITISSCDNDVDVASSNIPVTASVNNGLMTMVTLETRHEIIGVNQAASATLEVVALGKETSNFSVAIDGEISSDIDENMTGSMSDNGDSFILSAMYTEEESDGCKRGSVFQLSGIRTAN